MAHKVNIKPLSVNEAWKGRRFRTDKYKRYERDALLLLPTNEIPEGELRISFEFGYSSKCADIDNAIKPFMDIMQKKYGFNDSRVYEMSVKKTIVPKGGEYIFFHVETMG